MRARARVEEANCEANVDWRGRIEERSIGLNFFDGLRKGKSGSQMEVQVYDVECPGCGQRIRGRRTEGYQAVRCADCGDGIFVLPQSPFQEPPLRARPKKSSRPASAKGASAIPLMEAAAPEIVWTDPIGDENLVDDHFDDDDDFEPESRRAPKPQAAPVQAPRPVAPALEIQWVDESAPQNQPQPKAKPKPNPAPAAATIPQPKPAQAGSQAQAQPQPKPKPVSRPVPPASAKSAPVSTVAQKSFDLPEHDHEEEDERPVRKRVIVVNRPSRSKRPLMVFGLVALVLIAALGYRVVQSRKQSYPEMAARGWKDGIPALDSGKFDLAKRLLTDASNAVNGLSGEIEHADEILQAAQEANIFAELASNSLETIVQEAARANPDDWPSLFKAYRGQAIIFDVSKSENNDDPVSQVDYRVFVGPGPKPDKIGVLDLHDFVLLKNLRLNPGENLVFGARLESVELDTNTGYWKIRVESKSGVVLTHRAALEHLGWPNGEDPPATDSANNETPLKGAPRAQVAARLGKPSRVQRTAVQGALMEQWIYPSGKSAQYINLQRDSSSGQSLVSAHYTFP